jgi:hypothetical protein
MLPPQVFQESFGHRDEPFLRPVVATELVVEHQGAVEAAALGVQGGLRLAGSFGCYVEGGEGNRR